MTKQEAFDLIEREYEAGDGLLIKFRMSDDVKTKRLERFIEALKIISAHYTYQAFVPRHLAYVIMSFRDTLSASAGHWKQSRPEGLTL